MATGTVKAVWNGAPGYALQETGEELIPGETIVEIPAGEAEESHNWEIVGGTKAPTKDELVAQAQELGIDVPPKAKKDDVQALIDAHVPPADEETADDQVPAETPEETT